MAASYKPLFKLLIDRNMKKKELAERNGIEIIGSYIDRAFSAKTENRPCLLVHSYIIDK